MSENLNLKEIMELMDLRSKNPEAYKQFLNEFEIVATDIVKIIMKISKKVVEEIEEEENE